MRLCAPDKMARKEDLDENLSFVIDHSESKNLYLNDGRLARKSAQEVLQYRKIAGVRLDDISPNAAWKEAVFRFRIGQKLLPETFCSALAEQAWQKYVDFRIQKKQNLRIHVVLKFTYPNEEAKGAEGEGDGWISAKFAAPVNKDMLESNILAAINEIGSYHDRD